MRACQLTRMRLTYPLQIKTPQDNFSSLFEATSAPPSRRIVVKEGQQGLLSAGGALRAELWSDTDSEEENEGGDELASFEQPPVVVGAESLSEMRQRLKRVTIKSV